MNPLKLSLLSVMEDALAVPAALLGGASIILQRDGPTREALHAMSGSIHRLCDVLEEFRQLDGLGLDDLLEASRAGKLHRPLITYEAFVESMRRLAQPGALALAPDDPDYEEALAALKRLRAATS